MFARVTTIHGPEHTLRQGARLFEEHVLPWTRDVSGFRGVVSLIDAEGERGLVITLWESEEAMRSHEPSGARFRDLIAESAGSIPSEFDFYEVAALELPGLAG